MLQGLAPTPILELKMNLQAQDPVYGNGFVHQHIGTQTELRHSQFEYFFSMQDPLITQNPRKECPNFKVGPFFKWIKYVCVKEWNPGENLEGDEQKVTFRFFLTNYAIIPKHWVMDFTQMIFVMMTTNYFSFL